MLLVYDELRRTARHYMRGEREAHTLQTTALVNEAFLRLAGARRVEYADRVHFFVVAAQMMLRVLVDYARTRGYRNGAAMPHPSRSRNRASPRRSVTTRSWRSTRPSMPSLAKTPARLRWSNCDSSQA